MKLYPKIIVKLGIVLSGRDYESHLLNMTKDGFLLKERKRRNDIYIVTEMVKNARQLGILGVNDEKVERTRRLYQFLLLCDCFYKAKSISGEELDSVLQYVSATRKNLVVESHIQANGTNCCEIIYKPLSTIRVRTVELVNDSGKIYYYYYHEEDGFSIKEVIDLLKGLRDYPLFVGNFNYNEDDIKDSIELLRSLGLLRLIRSYNDKESRYSICEHIIQHDISSERDGSIQEMKDMIWNIHDIEMYYLDLKKKKVDLMN